mgnify:CR=1 FL=1
MQKFKENTAVSKIIAAALSLVILISGISAIIIGHVYKSANAGNELNEYKIAVEQGFSGSFDDFITALNGKTAYEVALKNNYAGNKKDYANALNLVPENGISGRAITNITPDNKTSFGIATYNGEDYSAANDIVAVFSSDFSTLTITKNTSEGEPKIRDNAFNSWYKIAKNKSLLINEDKKMNNVKSITVGEGIKTIPYSLFNRCINLKTITLPDSLEIIGDYALMDCYALTDITIPKMTRAISSSAFTGCNALTDIKLSNENPYFVNDSGVLYGIGKTMLIAYPDGKADTEYHLPSEVREIGDRAFDNCHNLEYITIPNTITKIGDYAFYDASLKKVSFEDDNAATIGFYAFWGCKNLTDVKLPKTLKGISAGAFRNCRNLETLAVPDTAQFSCQVVSYSGLKSFTVPKTKTSIVSQDFAGCKALTEITIPSSVTEISGDAFLDCDNLKTIYGSQGSYAEKFAKANGYTFVAK